MPQLENVMNNHMNCSIMLLGTRMQYAVTYIKYEKEIKIFKKKYNHDLQV